MEQQGLSSTSAPSLPLEYPSIVSVPPDTYVVERPIATRIPVYLAIASVPRHEDIDYLLQVLDSLSHHHFSSKQIYVFFNGLQNQSHLRWDQAHRMDSARGVHFLWNEAPLPDPHPSIHNFSVPLPDGITRKDGQVATALGDSSSRKQWRRKEFHDFLTISKYMLRQVYGNETRVSANDKEKIEDSEQGSIDTPFLNNSGALILNEIDIRIMGEAEKRQREVLKAAKKRRQEELEEITRRKSELDNSWIIFNQDDGEWEMPFWKVFTHLASTSDDVVDFFGGGLVSIGFRAGVLSRLVEYGEDWLDFKPVDWMISDFVAMVEKKPMSKFKAVKHIGKVSSRVGRIDNVVAGDSVAEQSRKSRIDKQPRNSRIDEQPRKSRIDNVPPAKTIATEPPVETRKKHVYHMDNLQRKVRGDPPAPVVMTTHASSIASGAILSKGV